MGVVAHLSPLALPCLLSSLIQHRLSLINDVTTETSLTYLSPDSDKKISGPQRSCPSRILGILGSTGAVSSACVIARPSPLSLAISTSSPFLSLSARYC